MTVTALTLGIATALFCVAYPFIAYYLLGHGYAYLVPLLLSATLLWRAYKATDMKYQQRLLGFAALLLAGALFTGVLASRLIPAVTYLLLALFFGQTLRRPPPLMERIVRLQYAEMPQEAVVYLRQLTSLWTGFFVLAALVSLGLSFFAEQLSWTLFHGVIVYLLIAVLLVGEYLYRPRRFPDFDIPPLAETFRVMYKNRHKLWTEQP